MANVSKVALNVNAIADAAVVVKSRHRKNKKNFPALIWNPAIINIKTLLLTCVYDGCQHRTGNFFF